MRGRIFGSFRNFRFRSPVSTKLINPLTNGEKIKRLKAMHTKNLAASGLRELRSPFK